MEQEPELETPLQPKPHRLSPRKLTPAERDHRRAILERQAIARQRGELMTDRECAEALGLSRNTWVGWKKSYRRKQRRDAARPASRRSSPAPRSSPARRGSAVAAEALDPAQARQLLLAMFDRGQAAVATLERIRDVIDEVLEREPGA